jgi:hydrogenase-4 transcriptional activator
MLHCNFNYKFIPPVRHLKFPQRFFENKRLFVVFYAYSEMKNSDSKDGINSERPNEIGGSGVVYSRNRKAKRFNPEEFQNLLDDIQQKLDHGLSSSAEKIVKDTIAKFSLNKNEKALLNRFLSHAIEMKGDYETALSVLNLYEDENSRIKLDKQTEVAVLTQLAISYSNIREYPKAIALLNSAYNKLQVHHSSDQLGMIYATFTRVYRKLTEFPIARDYAEKTLKTFRDTGNWRGMSEANSLMGAFCQEAGDLENALEYLQQAIKMVGDRQAPFILGRAYSDLSGTYWFMRRPNDGIECLEKSIKFFESTEHKNHATMAYNNLGINLMQIGEWTKAEAMIKQSYELAVETNHVHTAGILDSLGELKMLRGNLVEAEENFRATINIATERNSKWYIVQGTQNLARCLLAQEKFSDAIVVANKSIALSQKGGQKNYEDLSRLTLTECYLKTNQFEKCREQLEHFESDDKITDFFVLGSLQRIRGHLALIDDDIEIAFHHLSLSVTMFETAEDLYHTGRASFELGKVSAKINPEKAVKYLNTANEIFTKLDVQHLVELVQHELKNLEITEPIAKREGSANSQLLTLRLAEATASRELIFRELISILEQESKARKISIIQPDIEKRLVSFLSTGFTPAEAEDLATGIRRANNGNNLENFAKEKNLNIFALRSRNGSPAFLVTYPRLSANLVDGTSILTLLRVVELGMDVCALRERDRAKRNEIEENPLTPQNMLPGFIHSSLAMSALVEEVNRIRASDVTVLVTGESGTGKEVVSRAIHTLSNRKDKIFIPFNCTAVPKELAEGHLFGFRKGAFTGASQDSLGVIRAANGGTLFLDEIGDLPIDVQPKLLRFLQESEIHPLGERNPIKVDVRVIAATNSKLEEMVAKGLFREDLYYRLNVIRLRVPPLRERRSEIPAIVNYYVNHYSEKFKKRDITVASQTMDLLMVCEWKGNVRQLCNEIQRFVVRATDGDQILPEQLSTDLKRNVMPITFADSGNVRAISNHNSFNIDTENSTIEEAVSELEMKMITESMKRHSGNISRMARELGLTRRGLYLKLERYGLEKAS